MKKGAILYTKPIQFQKDGLLRDITVLGVLPVEGGEVIEVVANGKGITGEACFYKEVKSGEVMYGDRVATEDTHVFVGITSLTNVKNAKATLEALSSLEF